MAQLTLQRQLPRGAVSLRLSRELDIDFDDGARISTAAGLRLQRDLNTRSAFSIGADYRDVREEAGEDESALSLDATLSWQVDRAWALEGGIEYERRGDGDREGTSVFIGLRRSFDGLL